MAKYCDSILVFLSSESQKVVASSFCAFLSESAELTNTTTRIATVYLRASSPAAAIHLSAFSSSIWKTSSDR